MILVDYTLETARALMHPRERILVVDPGDVSGLLGITGNQIGTESLSYLNLIHRFKYGNMITVGEAAISVTLLIMEDFIVRPVNFGRRQCAPFVYGALEMWATSAKIMIVRQQPSQAKRIRLKCLSDKEWPCKTPHEWDALRHLFYFLHTR